MILQYVVISDLIIVLFLVNPLYIYIYLSLEKTFWFCFEITGRTYRIRVEVSQCSACMYHQKVQSENSIGIQIISVTNGA